MHISLLSHVFFTCLCESATSSRAFCGPRSVCLSSVSLCYIVLLSECLWICLLVFPYFIRRWAGRLNKKRPNYWTCKMQKCVCKGWVSYKVLLAYYKRTRERKKGKENAHHDITYYILSTLGKIITSIKNTLIKSRFVWELY